MGAAQTDKGSAPVGWGLIAASILGAVLLIAAIWSLSRALNNSAPHGSVALTNEATTVNAVPMQKEIERRQYEMAEQLTAPVIQAPAAAPPAVTPTKQKNDEVKLQKVKAKVNKQIVKRLQQYIKDHPERDNRDIEEQIKKRENQGTQIQ